MGSFLVARGGVLGLGWTTFVGVLCVRGLFRGIAAGEVSEMIASRRSRAATWALGLAALSFVLAVVPMDDRAGGEFKLRPARRVELRAPIAGFLKEVYCDVGVRVSPGAPVARLEVPDLDSRLAQKRAEVLESQARLKMLKLGPRPEEVAEQRLRVERSETWRDLARRDLDRATRSFREALAEIEQQIRQYQAECDKAASVYRTDRALLDRRAVQAEQVRESEKLWRVAESQLHQAEARHRARQAEGTLTAEAELARRETELADAEAKLRLLEAGTRPEEIDAETAHLARLEEEVRYLETQARRLPQFSPISGVVVTPRFKEKTGQFLQEGELICEVESMADLEAEIAVTEQDALRIRPGQPVRLKVRSLPYNSFLTTVDRIAPSMVRPTGTVAAGGTTLENPVTAAATPGTIVIYCRVSGSAFDLRSGMTGYARITYARRPIGAVLADRVLRVLRTEFWW
jgi:multidrug efflux pump subunit AcrA (membrane-fusion protein)